MHSDANSGPAETITAIRIWSAVGSADAAPGGVGRRAFFVDMEFEDGSKLGLWDGIDYGDAILVAGECSEGLHPVIDDVVVGPA